MGYGRRYRRVRRSTRGRRPGKYRRVLGVQGHRGATELKFVDVPTTNSGFANTLSISLLNGLQYGAAPYNRIGNRIRMRSIRVVGTIAPSYTNLTAGTENIKGRILLIYDRQTNGANPAWADIVMAYSQSGGTSSSSWDGIRMDNRDRFLVLRDAFINLPPLGVNGAALSGANALLGNGTIWGGLSDQQSGNYLINWYVPLRGLEAHYKNSTGLIGDLSTGGLFLITMGIDDPSVTPAWELEFNSRLRFDD